VKIAGKIQGQGQIGLYRQTDSHQLTYVRPSVRRLCAGGIPIDGVASRLTCFIY